MTKRQRCHHFHSLVCFSAVYTMLARPNLCLGRWRPTFRVFTALQNQYIHAHPALASQSFKKCLSYNTRLNQSGRQTNPDSTEVSLDSQSQRRRGSRLPAAPTSLRRVAVEAQRSKDGFISKALLREQGLHRTKVADLENFRA